LNTFGGGPFFTPDILQRQPALPLTHLDILLHRGGCSVRRLGSASFTDSAPETETVNEFFAAAHAGFVWVLCQFIHLTV
jgi:hypothetical protein